MTTIVKIDIGKPFNLEHLFHIGAEDNLILEMFNLKETLVVPRTINDFNCHKRPNIKKDAFHKQHTDQL